MIRAADTKAILRILADALPDQGEDLLTSIQIEEDADGGLVVRLKTRGFHAISAMREGADGIEYQMMSHAHALQSP